METVGAYEAKNHLPQLLERVAKGEKRLSEAEVVRFLALLANLPIMIEQETPERMRKEIVALARE